MKNKNTFKSNNFVHKLLLIAIILITIAGLITSSFFISNANWGADIGNKYQVIAKYEKASSAKEATTILQNKMDPLSKSRMDIHYLGDDQLNITTSEGNYDSLIDFRRNVERKGAIFFFDENGNDLLLGKGEGKNYQPTNTKDAKRIPLNEFIDAKTVKAVTTATYQPAVEFKVKSLEVYEAILKYLNPGHDKEPQLAMAPIYIWTDIGQLLDEIRNNADHLFQLRSYFYRQINDLQNKQQHQKSTSLRQSLREFLTADLFNRNNNQYVTQRDFSSDAMELVTIREAFSNYNVVFKLKSNIDLTIDVNEKDENYEKQLHLKEFAPYLAGLIKLFNDQKIEKYNKYLITSAPLQFNNVTQKAYVEVVRAGESIAQSLAKIIIAGLAGVSYDVKWQGIIQGKFNDKTTWIVMIVLFSIVMFAVLVYLIIIYRLWGIILSGILATIIVSSVALFNQLLGVYNWEVIIGLVIGLVIAFSSSIVLFERMKEEIRAGKGLIQAFKDGNRKSISTMFDISIIVLIMSIFIFWLGSPIFKTFAAMLIISITMSAFLAIFILRGICYALVHFQSVTNQSKFFCLTNVNSIGSIDSVKSNFFLKLKMPLKKYRKLIFLSLAGVIVIVGIILTFTLRQTNSLGFNKGVSFLANIWDSFENSEVRETEFLRVKEQISQYFQTNYKWTQFSIDVLWNEEYQYALLIKTSLTDLNSSSVTQIAEFLNNDINAINLSVNDDNVFSFINQNTTNLVLESLKMLGIMLAVSLVYTMIRFDWTFAVPLVATIIFDVILVIAFLIISRWWLSVDIVVAVIAVAIFSSIYKIMIFDRIRENKIGLKYSKLDQADLLNIKQSSLLASNNSIKHILLLNIMIMLPVFAVVSVMGSNFVIIIGIVLAFISANILLGWIWKACASVKVKYQKQRKQKITKNLEGIDEQKIEGINS